MLKMIIPLLAMVLCAHASYPSIEKRVRPVCGGLCRMYCEYGNVINDMGCPICKCRPPPIRPCPMLNCPEHCYHGYKVNRDGCLTCSCKPKIKPALRECPENSKSNIKCPVKLQHKCQGDSDCTDTQKCCLIGCAKKCI